MNDNEKTINSIPSAFIDKATREKYARMARDGKDVYAYQVHDHFVIWDGTKPAHTEQRVILNRK